LKGSRHIIKDSIENLKKTVVIPVDPTAGEAEAGIQRIDIKKLKEYNNPKAYLYELLNEYGFSEWNDIADLLEAQSGKQIVSGTHRIIKDRDYLLLTNLDAANSIKKVKKYEISDKDEMLEGDDFKLIFSRLASQNIMVKSQDIVFIDSNKLKFPLIVRKWKNGDYFYPSGMQGRKKVSKFFIDNKMSILQKEKIWLLCSANQVIWVIGERLDDRFKAIETTKNILKIENIR